MEGSEGGGCRWWEEISNQLAARMGPRRTFGKQVGGLLQRITLSSERVLSTCFHAYRSPRPYLPTRAP